MVIKNTNTIAAGRIRKGTQFPQRKHRDIKILRKPIRYIVFLDNPYTANSSAIVFACVPRKLVDRLNRHVQTDKRTTATPHLIRM